MATSGLVKDTRSISGWQEFTVSTCKISKVGIGGPLIDLDGNFHGINFYGDEETRFLPRRKVLEFLKSFGLSRWPVPKPYWSYPTIEEPADPLAELPLLPMDLDSSSLQCCSR
ncbi:hypothetical protein C2845_PM04G12230 [Panicum miliaceum]|uniref:Uncharacterized protein n=1 Tax=Panicum miliaceum TaxID=4540 RepID=A0A3L6QV51_PANMI|nr:hypothetical protein C2845_PM04G12230 [Panicum miliaceum]